MAVELARHPGCRWQTSTGATGSDFRGSPRSVRWTSTLAACRPDWQAPAAAGPVRARLRPPGSKSMTNRALVLAALADGPTVITNPLRARDTLLMAAALRSLGAVIEDEPDGATARDGRRAGRRPGRRRPAWRARPDARRVEVDVGNAGTVLRFVPPVAALTGRTWSSAATSGPRRARSGPLLAALRELGAVIDDGAGRHPVHRPRPRRDQRRHRDPGRLRLLAARVRPAAGRARATTRAPRSGHAGPAGPSAPHIAMTVQMLRDAGAEVETGIQGAAGAGQRRSVPDFWRVHPGELRPRHDGGRARPVQRRAVPRRGPGDRRLRHDRRLARSGPAAGRRRSWTC